MLIKYLFSSWGPKKPLSFWICESKDNHILERCTVVSSPCYHHESNLADPLEVKCLFPFGLSSHTGTGTYNSNHNNELDLSEANDSRQSQFNKLQRSLEEFLRAMLKEPRVLRNWIPVDMCLHWLPIVPLAGWCGHQHPRAVLSVTDNIETATILQVCNCRSVHFYGHDKETFVPHGRKMCSCLFINSEVWK